MAIFKKKDDGDKKPMAKASKPAVKAKMMAASPGLKKALGVDSLQSGKMYPFTKEAVARRDSSKASPKRTATLTRSVKTVMKPTATATIQRSTVNSKTGAVTKSAPKKMEMKSISAKEFNK